MQVSKNKILITGGASGIGRALTERFLKDNNTVIVCGWREELLRALKSEFPEVITKKCDLEIEAEREALYSWISEQHPDLQVLVNNAGIQNWTPVDHKDFFQRSRQEIAINIEAPLHLTSLFINLPSLRTVMNVTSGLAYAPYSKVAVYSATKAFFHSFTLSLRHLLKARNIEVIEIIPPALNTDLGGKGIHDFAPPVSGFIEAIFAQLAEGETALTWGYSAEIAKAGPEEVRQAFQKLNP
jgi:uncharacterized oxidoreductase